MSLLSKIISLGIILSSISPQLKSLRFKKGTSKEDEESLTEISDEALLKEYEVCQSHNNSLNSQVWVSISILITINLLILGQVISGIILKSVPVGGYANLIFVTLIGLFMIFILRIFWRWNMRVRFQVWVNNHRMQEIEERFSYKIRKNWRIRGLDLKYDNKQQAKWNRLDPGLQAIINRLSNIFPKSKKGTVEEQSEYSPPTTGGVLKFEYIFYALFSLWVISIILQALIYCPAVKDFLFND